LSSTGYARQKNNGQHDEQYQQNFLDTGKHESPWNTGGCRISLKPRLTNFLLKRMEVCTTGGRLSQTTDGVVEIVRSRKGSFLPTPECDMDAAT
jgi:hypothetical protein